MARSKTNADGEYQLVLPKPLTDAYLFGIGARNSDGVWCIARGKCESASLDGSQIIEFRDLSEDKDDADWVLKVHRN